jgi:gliding motility-associated-like protein
LDGNLIVYSNYEGGVLDIDVDQDIPDLRIGISTYDAVEVNIGGVFAANVTGVIYAGFDSPGGSCGNPANTVVNGVDPGIVQIYGTQTIIAQSPFLGDELFGIPLVNCMVSGGECGAIADGGGNSSPQIVQYFLSEFGAGTSLYSHWTDYECFPAAGFAASEGGNCCIQEPVTPVNPIYVTGGGYQFPIETEYDLCDGQVDIDLSFYTVLVQPPLYTGYIWSDGQTGPEASFTEIGTYTFTTSDYCNPASDPLTETITISDCGPEIVLNVSQDEICLGETAELSASVSGGALPYVFDWSPDLGPSNGPYPVQPDITTYYYLTVTDSDGISSTDSILITVDDFVPNLDLGEDQDICGGEVVLDATTAGALSYAWSDGSDSPDLSVSEPGTYSVTVEGACFQVSDEIVLGLSADITAELPDDAVLCPGASITLDMTDSNAQSYQWNTGSTDAVIEASISGQYTVEVFGACETVQDTFNLFISAPLTNPLEDSYELCRGQSLFLDASTSGATAYTWPDGSSESSYSISDGGDFQLSLANNCQSIQVNSSIVERICDCTIYIPTAFTPDGDGVNDRFRTEYSADCEFIRYSFRVYDRWGGLLFDSVDPQEFWNGTGLDDEFFAPDGIYTYVLEATVASPRGGTESLDQHGQVTLMR